MSFCDTILDGSGMPAVGERLVAPNTRYEIIDGELIYVPPSDLIRGTLHTTLNNLICAHAAVDFIVAIRVLTRVSQRCDFATEVSVYPVAPDPVTGGRQLEHLAFQIVSAQEPRREDVKAAKLMARGVRRVFAIHIEHSCALEWSAALGTWSVLDSSGHITDPALAVPLPIEAMLKGGDVDDVIARALIYKRNPVIEALRAQARAEGKQTGLARARAERKAEGEAAGMAESVLVVLAARGVPVSPAARARILAEQDLEQLARWIARTATCTEVDDLMQALEAEISLR